MLLFCDLVGRCTASTSFTELQRTHKDDLSLMRPAVLVFYAFQVIHPRRIMSVNFLGRISQVLEVHVLVFISGYGPRDSDLTHIDASSTPVASFLRRSKLPSNLTPTPRSRQRPCRFHFATPPGLALLALLHHRVCNAQAVSGELGQWMESAMRIKRRVNSEKYWITIPGLIQTRSEVLAG